MVQKKDNTHTCSHRIGDTQYTWNVHHLWELAKSIEPISFSMDKLEHTLDWQIWGTEPLSPRVLIEHYTQTVECDLHYPIILSVNRWGNVDHIYDGFHRIVKAKYKGYEKIMVVVIDENILTKEENYISAKRLTCGACECDPCDCDWGCYT